jgi:hypothetical protein
VPQGADVFFDWGEPSSGNAPTKKTGRSEGRWGRFLPARGRKIEFSLMYLVRSFYNNFIFFASPSRIETSAKVS